MCDALAHTYVSCLLSLVSHRSQGTCHFGITLGLPVAADFGYVMSPSLLLLLAWLGRHAVASLEEGPASGDSGQVTGLVAAGSTPFLVKE